MILRPKGTKDVLPDEIFKWQHVENIYRKLLSEYNFSEIRTPIFEHTELFARGVGETSDVVSKEMYTFEDKGGRSITLKPEGTSAVVRAVIENGLQNEQMPLKLFTFTPCFRYEKPQLGRLREHHQCSIESFGSADSIADVEIILIVKTLFERLGFSNYILNINSIGCKTCRSQYLADLKKYYARHITEMCEDCKARLDKNPLRLLDCKDARCKKFKKEAPKITDYLCEDCKNHYEKLKFLLKDNGVQFEENPYIVRGLDYYNRTVFEFLTKEEGALGTICGGGRYDRLFEICGGKPMPAVGVGVGFERLLSVLEKNGIEIVSKSCPDLFVATFSEQEKSEAFKFVTALRNFGLNAVIDTCGRSFKAQLKYANSIAAKFLIVYGSDEINTKRYKVKNMKTGSEKVLEANQIADYVFKEGK